MPHLLVIWKTEIMRVAVAQFATSLNVQENLATCIRMINEAATCKPSLIVLPEFCNTQPCYTDHNQAWQQALTLKGGFLQSIAEQAKVHACHIALNVTLRRDRSRDNQKGTTKSNISITSCLFSPLGELIQQTNKHILTEAEKYFFSAAGSLSEEVNNPYGELGLLAGSDIMTFDASRHLAIDGVELVCHSMSTFALDQSQLHGPARAGENNIFIATANKVGPLLSPEHIFLPENLMNGEQPWDSHKEMMGIGQSQIISPNGKVLAKIDNKEEGYIFADINFAQSNSRSTPSRPDGTDLIKQRRPELYQRQPLKTVSPHEGTKRIPVTANVAIFATYTTNEQAIDDVCHYIENNLSDITQLPELFFISDKETLLNTEQMTEAAHLSQQVIKQVSAVLRPFQYVCTSLVIEGKHQGVLINSDGLFATQQQLHFCNRYRWSALGDHVNTIDLPLEQGCIKVAILTADDANIPEIVKTAALQAIHVLLVPFDIQEPSEVEYSLLSRAVENRVCIVAATREKNFTSDLPIESKNKNKVKLQKSTGLIINLTTDDALLPQWKSRKFDGHINPPLIKHQHGKITKAVIHPIAACHKLYQGS